MGEGRDQETSIASIVFTWETLTCDEKLFDLNSTFFRVSVYVVRKKLGQNVRKAYLSVKKFIFT